MRRFRIYHETTYQYQSDVTLGDHRLLVRPRDGHDVRIEESRLDISPKATVSWHRDELDNSVALLTFDPVAVKKLRIVSEVVVTHYSFERQLLPLTEDGRCYPVIYSESEKQRLSPLMQTLSEARLADWVGGIGGKDSPLFLNTLCQQIYDSCHYQERYEEGVQGASETLEKLSGSCRDYAWLFVSAARAVGFAARFVSGYFHTAGTSLSDGHTHAWAEVYLPGAGWTGFDPTCNRMTAENHIPVAVAVLPEDIPPVSGSFTGRKREEPSLGVRVRVKEAD